MTKIKQPNREMRGVRDRGRAPINTIERTLARSCFGGMTRRACTLISRTLTGLSLFLLLLLPSTGSTPAHAESGTWRPAGTMSTPRAGHTATVLSNGELLVAGGCAGTNGNGLGLASAEVYDPSAGIWRLTGDMTGARVNHTATLLPGGEVLVAGGIDVDRQVLLTSTELYSPTTGSWNVTGSLKIARHLHTATLLPSGKILVAGGSGGGASAELYDPATGTWTLTGSMTTARIEHTAMLLPSGRVLVVGGSLFGRSAELYEPATGRWALTDSNITARASHTATLLASGEVLVAGSLSLPYRNSAVASAELYGPEGWSLAGSMTDARFEHTASLLPSGEVLVAGGTDNFVDYASAELFDPTTRTWRPTTAMTSVRWRHTASTLPEGQVLVVGGMASGTPLASAELYTSPGVLFQAYLHGSGGNANPSMLFLDDSPPTAAAAKYKDSARVNFAAGNPWVPIGTWTAERRFTAGPLPTLSDLHVWVGLKNSDDIGTQFDLLAELSKNGTVFASGVARCITGITRNAALAKEATVPFDPFPSVDLDRTTDILSLQLLTT